MDSSTLTPTPAVPPWIVQLEAPPAGRNRVPGIPDPPGYSNPSGSKKKDPRSQPKRPAPTQEEMETLKLKKAWEVALAPVKSLPMTAIMMYMSGNSLQIFSIMMVFMAFKNPLVGLMGTNQAFEKFRTDGNESKLLQTKVVYVAMQLVALGVGIWKVNAMGLLPTTRSDWLMWESQRLSADRVVMAL
ncbi:ER membrane protein complex subunit 4 [Ophiocordyceps camponoti-floridani]|uniref:ER membrane protein complex subunit 4 n=1 Tax=Ophiocordyceps camponoti-floridani TaxID=2030778 RepID=A0A8H4Q632_9HYPO|nr:ER membrane protein complex subunit 4 [Ophiocordyceps camponoti-floridani]